MKKFFGNLFLVVMALAVTGFCGCKRDEPAYTIRHHRFAASMTNLLYNSDLDEARIKILKENGFYYYNADVKKCYWVVLIYRGVAFDAVDCRDVVRLLVNKGEYQKLQLKLEKE